mmetsp:Transcript_16129/g.22278  ORF Transcript_16129/g.22278 Transcript_16129/m.22278 type:complete len:356 (+) Transcript_16129:106-1173(+)|eukprot:CAMPEP_0196592060 /NCGR_PEP_ID=MMETSP1081-20130531/71714_1 /TAXON_ID=36882 /ORGANISM="Pyramimonas amylifera, Strain CCMP720" /LENGTH=355 /DNA_ID=CAMNT_0041915631 /DNA_START=88 /DNA_END=1155 /DNA_ORIENTATION=-
MSSGITLNNVVLRSEATSQTSSSATRKSFRMNVPKAKQYGQNPSLFKGSKGLAAETGASLGTGQKFSHRRKALRVSASSEKTAVMINDISGKMGQAVATAAMEAGLVLVPYSLTGPPRDPIDVGGVTVEFFDTSKNRDAAMEKAKNEYPNMIVVDYTVPMCVNQNAEFYIKHQTPFVMGTTGGDREKLLKDVKEAGLYAVIAPQMGKQVVAFQAAMKILADSFPGAFAGYTMQVTESHQSSKVDTSGTAKAIVDSFQNLGLDFEVDQIEMVRETEEQMSRMEVPEEHLLGHAFHTYHLTSADGNVNFEFQHNVCGRSIYAQGTVDAALCLAAKIAQGSDKKLFDMIDVLKEGNMR